MSEELLADKIESLLRAQGYHVYREVPFWLRRIDIYAVQPGGTPIAIEVKLRDWRTALTQAKLYQLGVQHVYVAMPGGIARRMEQRHFKDASVGVMAVDDGIEELLPPRRSAKYRKAYRDMLVLSSKPTEGEWE